MVAHLRSLYLYSAAWEAIRAKESLFVTRNLLCPEFLRPRCSVALREKPSHQEHRTASSTQGESALTETLCRPGQSDFFPTTSQTSESFEQLHLAGVVGVVRSGASQVHRVCPFSPLWALAQFQRVERQHRV